MPPARLPTTIETGVRVPRMIGLPWQIAGSIVIRSSMVVSEYASDLRTGKPSLLKTLQVTLSPAKLVARVREIARRNRGTNGSSPEQLVAAPSHQTPHFAPTASIHSTSPSHVRMFNTTYYILTVINCHATIPYACPVYPESRREPRRVLLTRPLSTCPLVHRPPPQNFATDNICRNPLGINTSNTLCKCSS